MSLDDYMKRCKKDWLDEEQEEFDGVAQTLHELKEWWKNMDKSGDENSTALLRNVSRATKSEGKNDDTGMFTHSSGNPELEKILELKMMEKSGFWVSEFRTGKSVLKSLFCET